MKLNHTLRLCQEWWDSAALAGPKTRVRAPFAEARPALDALIVRGGTLMILCMHRFFVFLMYIYIQIYMYINKLLALYTYLNRHKPALQTQILKPYGIHTHTHLYIILQKNSKDRLHV